MQEKKVNLILAIIMGTYLAFVSSTVDYSLVVGIYFVIKSIAFSFLIYKFILPFIKKIKLLNNKDESLTKKDYFIWFILIVGILLITLYVYYPVNLTASDISDQYNQALNDVYNDWHPVIHTLLFYRLPMIINKSPITPCIFQIIFIACCLLYFCNFLHRHGFNKKTIYLLLFIIILNPSFLVMSITLFKDVAFAYCIFLATLCLFDMYLTDNLWLKSFKNFSLFFFACFGIAFFRHNGIANFICMMLVMLLFNKRVRLRVAFITLSILLLRFTIIPNIYRSHYIGKTDITVSEIVDVMYNQLAHIYNYGNPTDEQVNNLAKFYNLEDLKNKYNPYDFYAIKYHSNFAYYAAVVDKNVGEFFALWWDLVKSHPKLAFHSFLYSTNHIWRVNLSNEEALSELYWIAFNITPEGKTGVKKVLTELLAYNNLLFCQAPFTFIFVSVGFGLYIAFFALGYCLKVAKKKMPVMVPFVPLLANALSLMLIIPGRETRFIYSNILCAIPFLTFMIIIGQSQRRVINNEEKNYNHRSWTSWFNSGLSFIKKFQK